MKTHILTGLIALGICTTGSANVRTDYPPISFVGPSSGKKAVSPDEYVILVIEGSYLSHEKSPVAAESVIGHVNGLLRAKGGTFLGVHIREGAKYGDVVRAPDTLRQTEAKSISVSLFELPVGRDL